MIGKNEVKEMTKTRRGEDNVEVKTDLKRVGWDESSWCFGCRSSANPESKPVEFYQGTLSRFWPHTNYWEVLFKKLSPCPLLHFTAN